MKVLVAYMSQTGNTRKIAEAIFVGLTMSAGASLAHSSIAMAAIE